MKLGELPEHISLGNVRFIFPGDGQEYYWHSQWNKGVWGKKSPNDSRMYPLCVEDLKEALEWEVVEDDGRYI